MYYCNECKKEFEKLKRKKINLEVDYGINHLFSDSHYIHIEVCPFCEEADYEELKQKELKQCSQCEEWFDEDDLYDTEEAIGGGCGYLCEQCLRDSDIVV